MSIVKSKRIAITGSMGSGKSEVASIFRKSGFYVFDADKYNKELLTKKDILNEVKYEFPFVFDGNNLNKFKLREIIFNDDSARFKLESITHQRILEELLERQSQNPISIAEVPLLFESNWQQYFDIIIVVISNDQVAKKRLLFKGYSPAMINKTWHKQMLPTTKIKLADVVFYNDKSLDVLEINVKRWIEDNLYD